jgi:hypothetical protein
MPSHRPRTASRRDGELQSRDRGLLGRSSPRGAPGGGSRWAPGSRARPRGGSSQATGGGVPRRRGRGVLACARAPRARSRERGHRGDAVERRECAVVPMSRKARRGPAWCVFSRACRGGVAAAPACAAARWRFSAPPAEGSPGAAGVLAGGRRGDRRRFAGPQPAGAGVPECRGRGRVLPAATAAVVVGVRIIRRAKLPSSESPAPNPRAAPWQPLPLVNVRPS